jgi:hypothetical protein
MSLRITKFLDFDHRPEFWTLENTTFRKLDVFLFSGERGEAHTLLGPLERANLNRWTTHFIQQYLTPGSVHEMQQKKKSKAIPVTGRGGL